MSTLDPTDREPNAPPLFDTTALAALAVASAAAQGDRPCAACQPLQQPGWESLPGAFDATCLRRIGTLQQPGIDEPTLREHHPRGTHGWSADAPIAPAWFPYNRCDVWVCTACARPYLRYTEYGGYYQDARIRALDAALLDATPA